MYKKCLLFLLLFLFSLSVNCLPVSEDRARQVAINFGNEVSDSVITIDSVSFYNNNRQSLIYVVKLLPRGYLLVSGDDAAKPVLGYDLIDIWDGNELPVQFINLINDWSEQIRFIRKIVLKIREDAKN
ncbi:MAG: Spi family protease inhibitor [Candidatus Cloacimonadaceae bacterium]